MGYSDFPNGATSFGLPLIGSGQIPVTTGTYFFVDSGHGNAADAANHGKTSNRPFATIDYAIGKCTAGAGDVIIVAPGHTESIAAAGGITADVSGVSIIGLGSGFNRPTITLGTATTATFAVSGLSTRISNFIFASGIDELATVFSITGVGVTIENCLLYETSTDYSVASFITASSAADFLTVRNCEVFTVTAPTANGAYITLAGGDNNVIENCKGVWTGSNHATSGAIYTSAAVLRIVIKNNDFLCPGGANVVPISLYAASTGYVSRNCIGSAKTAIAGSVALANAYGAENYASNTVNTNGILDPAADS